jgi:general secretion pathway protein J
VQLVVWSLRQGVWQRWAGPITNQESALAQAWAQVPQMQGREPGHVTLAEGVSGWQVYFFRGNAWANAQSTGDLVAAGVAASQGSQALPNRERLPQGVRLMITMQGPSGNGTLTRDVLVPGGQP